MICDDGQGLSPSSLRSALAVEMSDAIHAARFSLVGPGFGTSLEPQDTLSDLQGNQALQRRWLTSRWHRVI